MTRYTMTLVVVCASLFLRAQVPVTSLPVDDPSAPKMVFDDPVYDFDVVKQGDTVIHEFRFTNKGKSPLIISDVTASCGCVCPTYSKEPVPPGKTGIIKMEFRTAGKMGLQDKTLTVRSNSSTGDLVLHMKGTVAHYRKGDHGPMIIFKPTVFNYDTVAHNANLEHVFRFANTGDQPLVISSVTQGFGYPDFTKEPIAPGDSGYVTLRYSASGHYGQFWKSATVESNALNGSVSIMMTGTIAPDPNGPIMKFDTTTYWFDTVYQSSIIDCEFRFTNMGKSPLVISNVTGNSGSVVPSYPKEPIAPGKSGMIRVVFHTGGRMGAQDKSVTVTSNASQPSIVLRIKGYVILPPLRRMRCPRLVNESVQLS